MDLYHAFLRELDDMSEKDKELTISCLQNFVNDVDVIWKGYHKGRKTMTLQEHKKNVEQNLFHLSRFIPKRELAINADGVPYLDDNKNFVYIQRGENPEVKAMYNALSAMYEYINAIQDFNPSTLSVKLDSESA